MLRLFRNFLCLASVLQVGTAVQAQQTPAKAQQSPAKTAVPVVKAKPAPSKPEASTVVAKPAKAEPAATAPAAAASKSVKAEPAAAPLKMGPAKPVKAETASKANKGTAKVAVERHSSPPRPGLVPPPPPDTPTMFAGDGFPPGFGMFDYNNPAALAGRRKDIASQLASAKKMLIDKEQRAKELKEKAVQFEQLFSEGVISRRELESAQKDSASAITELSDAKTQAISYQNAMSRLDERMKPKSVAAKKNAKGKIKAATKGSLKVAGTSTTPAKTAVTSKDSSATTTPGSTTPATTTSTTTAPKSSTLTTTSSTPDSTTTATDSTVHAAIKATPGP